MLKKIAATLKRWRRGPEVPAPQQPEKSSDVALLAEHWCQLCRQYMDLSEELEPLLIRTLSVAELDKQSIATESVTEYETLIGRRDLALASLVPHLVTLQRFRNITGGLVREFNELMMLCGRGAELSSAENAHFVHSAEVIVAAHTRVIDLASSERPA